VCPVNFRRTSAQGGTTKQCMVCMSPWVILEDFNMTPAEASSAGWLSWVNGVALTADSLPTDRSANGRLIDFAIAPRPFLHMFCLSRVKDVFWGPHDGIQLTFSGGSQWDCPVLAPIPFQALNLCSGPDIPWTPCDTYEEFAAKADAVFLNRARCVVRSSVEGVNPSPSKRELCRHKTRTGGRRTTGLALASHIAPSASQPSS
jgi:hypothetical protein